MKKEEEAKVLEEIILKRELKFRCLGCGKDLSLKIMDRKIRIHLCEDCRKIYMDKFSKMELDKFYKAKVRHEKGS